jgi:two-component system LytT family response regulator
MNSQCQRPSLPLCSVLYAIIVWPFNFVAIYAILTKIDPVYLMKIKTLIVDDEELARERLRGLLTQEPEIDLVGEAGDGRTALEAIHELKPQLVFLDVQMPELTGFEVLENLPETDRPNVVFVTAHDKFALKAFDVHAIDYLLKPFDKDRFKTALKRALDKIKTHRAGGSDEKVTSLLSEVKSKPLDRLMVKTDGRMLLIKVDDIDWVEAADNYVSLHVGNDSHLMRETMTSLEQRLSPEKFMRISRSTIVNVERIKELQPMFHGEYVVILRNGAKLTLSRTYRDKLDTLMGNA